MNNSIVPKYIRIQDNQVALFVDLYLAKKVASSFEAEHSVFRRLRLGTAHRKYFFEDKMNDNLLLKALLAYRLRLR